MVYIKAFKKLFCYKNMEMQDKGYDQKLEPLSEILRKRRNFYVRKFREMLDEVYKSEDLKYIKRVEEGLSEGKLEELISRKEPVMALPAPPKKPLLTLELYTKERDDGILESEIRQKYRQNKPHSISGYRMQYAIAKKKKATKQKRRKPRLTYKRYCEAVDNGLDVEEIKKRFRINPPRQLGGFISAYNKYKLRLPLL